MEAVLQYLLPYHYHAFCKLHALTPSLTLSSLQQYSVNVPSKMSLQTSHRCLLFSVGLVAHTLSFREAMMDFSLGILVPPNRSVSSLHCSIHTHTSPTQ